MQLRNIVFAIEIVIAIFLGTLPLYIGWMMTNNGLYSTINNNYLTGDLWEQVIRCLFKCECKNYFTNQRLYIWVMSYRVP